MSLMEKVVIIPQVVVFGDRFVLQAELPGLNPSLAVGNHELGGLELFEEQTFSSTVTWIEMSSGAIPWAGHLHICWVVPVASRATSCPLSP